MNYRRFVTVLVFVSTVLLAACGSVANRAQQTVSAAATQAAPEVNSAATEVVGAATQLAPTVESAQTQLAPTIETAATQLGPAVESAATQMAPTAEALATQIAPTMGAVVNGTITAQLPSTGSIDPCSLVTPGDAGEALGVTVTSPSSRTESGMPIASCQYQSGDKMVMINTFEFSGVSDAAGFFAQELNGIQNEKTYAPVKGLGEQAYQVANGVVFVQKNVVVMINVFFNPDLSAQENRDKAISLANLAVSRIP